VAISWLTTAYRASSFSPPAASVTTVAVDPCRLPADLGHRAGEFARLVDEVGEVDAAFGVKLVGQGRRRSGHAEAAEREADAVGVLPEPEHAIAVDGRLHGVLPGDLGVEQRLGDRRRLAQQHRVAVDAVSGQSVEPRRTILSSWPM